MIRGKNSLSPSTREVVRVMPALNRITRLQAARQGGQTRPFLPTYQVVRDHLPADVELIDIGAHRLKDLRHHEHIYKIVSAGQPSDNR